MNKGAGECKAHPLTAGEAVHEALLQWFKRKALQGRCHMFSGSARRHPQTGEQGQVLAGAEIGIQRRLLGQPSDLVTRPGMVAQPFSHDPKLTLRVRQRSRQGLQSSRFSGAIDAEQANRFALLQRE